MPATVARVSRLPVVLLVLVVWADSPYPRTALAATISDCSDLAAVRATLEAGGTIVINCGVVTLDFGSELVIDSDTTIDGVGTTLSLVVMHTG